MVVLTRETGKNDKVRKLLEGKGVHCLEVPMVETVRGPDVDELPKVLQQQSFDWVCITSPEAATVFAEGWIRAGRPKVRIAVVGVGTGKVLDAMNEPTLMPRFTPSVANAEHFGPELPMLEGGTNAVLYPSSAKASTVLQDALQRRGYRVMRLNTYSTVTVKNIVSDVLDKAKQAKVVAVASPSALKAWVEHVGQERAGEITVAAIGSTSARAAEKLGLEKIVYPEKPGVDTFVDTILEALAIER